MTMQGRQDGFGWRLVPLLGLLLCAAVLAGCNGDGGGVALGAAGSPAGAGNTVEEEDADAAGAAAGTGSPEDSTETTGEPASDPAERARDVAGAAAEEGAVDAGEGKPPLPFLIDLGATKCIPCKMMAPILEELAETKSDDFEVIFYDVWEDRSKGQEFGIRAIPTQIFFSAQGEELFRHVGFYSREQILKKWRELGVDVGE